MGGSSGTPPRSRTKQEAEAEWPSDALQVMKAQLRLLRGEEEEQESGGGDGDEVGVGVGGGGGGGRGPAGWPTRTKNVSIDLQVQPALPHGWEQFLDLNTGEVYYIDWSTCKRTRRDPRELLRTADAKVRALSQELQRRYYNSTTSFSASSTSAASVACLGFQQDDIQADEDEATSTLCSSSCLPGDAGEQPVDTGDGGGGGGGGDVMVALGCHRCLMYFMLPSSDPSCPGCGALLQVKTS